MNEARVDLADSETTWKWPDRYGPWGAIVLFAAVVTLYGIGSRVAIVFIEASGMHGVLFIPAGITVAFLLRLPRNQWWVVVVAAGITEFAVDLYSGFTISESLGFSVANMIEPLVGAWIVTAACGAIDLTRRRHLIWFTIGAVLTGPAVGAALGAGADRLFAGDEFLTTFGQWWLGDALGVILVGSAILAFGSSRDRRSLTSPGGIGLVAGSMALTAAVFVLSDLPLVFSVLIGVVVAGVLFGVRAVAVTALSVAITIAVVLANESGPLMAGMEPESALVLMKLQVALFTVAGLLIAAESHERELAISRAERAALEAVSLERERQNEREIGRRIQRGLLPDLLLTPAGMDIAAQYEAASDDLEVGGDWYDTIDLGESRIGVVVGDIVGHGIDAMISMGRLRTALAALALHNDDPATLLSELDAFVGGPDGPRYATAFYAVLDSSLGVVNYASAGHPPGLLLDPDGRGKWLEEGQSEPLTGLSTTRPGASATFEPGSTLILYSDGLIERRGESLSSGMRRLESLASQFVHRPADAMCHGLFEGLFTGTDRGDDAVVLVVRAGIESRTYHEVFPAVPEELKSMRASIRSWATAVGISAQLEEDLLIAVGEATANVVRHAYRESNGEVTIRIEVRDGSLLASVSDSGTWRIRGPEADTPGLGTTIMQAVTDEVTIDHTGHGTNVVFRIAGADVDSN